MKATERTIRVKVSLSADALTFARVKQCIANPSSIKALVMASFSNGLDVKNGIYPNGRQVRLPGGLKISIKKNGQ